MDIDLHVVVHISCADACVPSFEATQSVLDENGSEKLAAGESKPSSDASKHQPRPHNQQFAAGHVDLQELT